jgi:hypothetical protein
MIEIVLIISSMIGFAAGIYIIDIIYQWIKNGKS